MNYRGRLCPPPFSSATGSIRSSAQFKEYTRSWLTTIPKAGGDLIGYCMPHKAANNIAFTLISFDSLAAYEIYRARLRTDSEGVANFDFAQEHKFIVAEERTFLRKVMTQALARDATLRYVCRG